jgi:DNA-binding transcriptional LysR family regulator
MNLLHLKYAVEIAETASMTKAAENLYTAQPNLSRAIRELETSLGITIFKRTFKGIYPTPQGEEFLGYARKILAQVDEIEAMYRNDKQFMQKFSISVPRASYISCAFTEFSKKLDPNKSAEIFYRETNSMRAISNIINADYNLGILRYQSVYDKYFKDMLKEKGLDSELICEFGYVLLMSEKHPLASVQEIHLADLKPYTEIAHADPFVPNLPLSTVKKNEISDESDKLIYVFEQASQMDLLSERNDTFMWVSPVPERILSKFGLVEKECPENTKKYVDILIYKKDYRFSELDKLFIDELMKYKRMLFY